jgi:hypothetical protein
MESEVNGEIYEKDKKAVREAGVFASDRKI